jgi:hypothetical protein
MVAQLKATLKIRQQAATLNDKSIKEAPEDSFLLSLKVQLSDDIDRISALIDSHKTVESRTATQYNRLKPAQDRVTQLKTQLAAAEAHRAQIAEDLADAEVLVTACQDKYDGLRNPQSNWAGIAALLASHKVEHLSEELAALFQGNTTIDADADEAMSPPASPRSRPKDTGQPAGAGAVPSTPAGGPMPAPVTPLGMPVFPPTSESLAAALSAAKAAMHMAEQASHSFGETPEPYRSVLPAKPGQAGRAGGRSRSRSPEK